MMPLKQKDQNKNVQFNIKTVHFIKLLPLGTWINAVAKTDSMAPTIRAGQDIYIQRVALKTIRRGSIIAYTRSNKRSIIVHRVINKIKQANKIWFETKGDNLQCKDSYRTPQKLIIGIVSMNKATLKTPL